MKEQLKQITAQYQQTHDALCEQSRKEYMNSLPPGSSIPEPGRFYTDEARAQFAKECHELRAKKDEILGGVLEEINGKITAPPSTDAVNTVALLNARENVSEDEYDALLTKYKDDVPAYRAIKDSAVKHGYRGVFKEHPLDEYAQRIDIVNNSMNSLLTPIGKPHTGAGYISMIDAMIDNAFDE